MRNALAASFAEHLRRRADELLGVAPKARRRTYRRTLASDLAARLRLRADELARGLCASQEAALRPQSRAVLGTSASGAPEA